MKLVTRHWSLVTRLAVLLSAFGIRHSAFAQQQQPVAAVLPMTPVVEAQPLPVDARGYVIVGAAENDFAAACEQAQREQRPGVYVPWRPSGSYLLTRKARLADWSGTIEGDGAWSLIWQQGPSAYIEAVHCPGIRIVGLTFQTGAAIEGGAKGFAGQSKAAVVLARAAAGAALTDAKDSYVDIAARGNYTVAPYVNLACEISENRSSLTNYWPTGALAIYDSQDRYGLGFAAASAADWWTCSAHRVAIDGAVYGPTGAGLVLAGHTSDVRGDVYLQASGVAPRVRVIAYPQVGSRGSVPSIVDLDVYEHGKSPRTLSVWRDARPLQRVMVRDRLGGEQPTEDTRAAELEELLHWIAPEGEIRRADK